VILSLAILYLIVLVAFLTIYGPRHWLLNPIIVFALGQALLFLGSLPLLDENSSVDRTHALVMLVTLAMFMIGALARSRAHPIGDTDIWWSESTKLEEGQRFWIPVLGLLAFSLTITTLYYRAVGSNVFLDSVLSMTRTGAPLANAEGLREQFYRGSVYFAPGYVNQFKNIILPFLTSYFILRYRLSGEKADYYLGLGLLPAAILSLLGTGQRGAFADWVVFSVLFALAALPKKQAKRTALYLLVGGLVFFGLGTFFLGRGPQSSNIRLADQPVLAVMAEIWERGVWGNQETAVVGFRYVFHHSTVWGSDWLQSVSQLLPKNLFPDKSASSLPLDIFELLYGGRGGTAPPSLWGSVWYNFGAAGIVLVPMVMGWQYHRLYSSLFNRPKTLARIMIYAGATMILGLWIIGGPESLFNRGLITVFILKLIVSPRLSDQSIHGNGVRQRDRAFDLPLLPPVTS
jgi:oligosaccharide repeat unit polymerase